ncbi:MAG: hypothetical protein GY788_23660 [bacterium]|nr:hypothetical protein [bacterium]
MLALIDESVVEDQRGFHYVIACALVLDATGPDDTACLYLRERLTHVLAERKRPFRWKDEGIVKKGQVVDLIVESELFAVAAISHPGERYHQRRNRAECLTVVCQQLAVEGVSSIIVESRSDQDQDDVRAIRLAQKDGRLPANFPDLQFRDKTESLLWLPDAVAGAVREAETRTNESWMHRLVEGGGMLGVHRL